MVSCRTAVCMSWECLDHADCFVQCTDHPLMSWLCCVSGRRRRYFGNYQPYARTGWCPAEAAFQTCALSWLPVPPVLSEGPLHKRLFSCSTTRRGFDSVPGNEAQLRRVPIIPFFQALESPWKWNRAFKVLEFDVRGPWKSLNFNTSESSLTYHAVKVLQSLHISPMQYNSASFYILKWWIT